MRLRFIIGLLVLGMALGALIGLSTSHSRQTVSSYPLLNEHVRLIGELYARGESLTMAQARLEALGAGDSLALVSTIAAGGGAYADGSDEDLASALLALAPRREVTQVLPARVLASGRGSDTVSGPRAEPPDTLQPTPTPIVANGQVCATKTEASLRASPVLDSPALRIVPRGGEIVLLALEKGQAVEGTEDRWYKVTYGGAVGYVYFNLVEPLR